MRAASWLIPAHAGKTCDLTNGFCTLWAHPRSRGENDPSCTDSLTIWGSSPLTRGKRGFAGRADKPTGLIPAHAGKTCFWSCLRAASRAHPRSRGENATMEDMQAAMQGSSPLTRGKHDEVAVDGSRGGLIPAHAGKTYRYRQTKRLSGAHPRSRGENRRTSGSSACRSGSSPLTRGKLGPSGTEPQRVRLIPAHAGKTVRGPHLRPDRWAHPRSRGENRATGSSAARQRGSSPLTRGKQRRRLVRRVGGGLIPAHAGKTSRRRPPSSPNGAHPRSRGENFKGDLNNEHGGGSSPLTRGKRLHHA